MLYGAHNTKNWRHKMKQKAAENSDAVPSGIQSWWSHQPVAHRITGRRGQVVSVDFEEDLAEVAYDDYSSWVRCENLYETS